MSLNIKIGAPVSPPQIEDLDTRANLCKNIIQQPSKMTIEPSQRGIFLCDANRSNNSVNLKKDGIWE